MKKIWKYKLSAEDKQLIVAPVVLTPLSVTWLANDGLYMWTLVDPDSGKTDYVVRLFATGQPINDSELDGFVFVDTIHITELGLVFHVFMEK